MIPQSGVYAPLGEDMKAGWDLWLDQHGGKLGGREVETVVVDEGEGPDTGVPAVQKVLQQDRVDAVVGIVNSATALGVGRHRQRRQEAADRRQRRRRPADRARASTSGARRSRNGQVAYAVGKHLATTPEGKKGVYAMAADYAAGEEAIAGFKKGFEEGGGKIVGAGEDAVRDHAGLPAVPGQGAQLGRRARCTCSTRAPRPCRSSSSTRSSGCPTARRCTARGS